MHLTTIAPPEFSVRFVLALLCGALIGLERQLLRHEAGLKTNALVCGGSALFTMMASTIGEPDRVVGNIVSGIGFLGAGMILRDGLHVRGLNTAATLWCSAAIGTLAGAGSALTSLIATMGVVLANIILREIAEIIERKQSGADSEIVRTVPEGQ